MSRYVHQPTFNEFFGVDLRSSEKTRTKGFSGDGSLNCLHTAQGGIGARPGTKNIERNAGMLGIFAFEQTDILGTNVKRIIGFGGGNSVADCNAPYKLVESTFTLTNTHATNAATVSMKYDTATSQYRFQITRGSGFLLDQAIGTSNGTTLAALQVIVDALSAFTMTTTSGTPLACHIQLMNEETIAANGGTLTVTYWYWEQVNKWSFSGSGNLHHAYELGLDSYSPVSAVVIRGVLYCSSGAVTGASINGNAALSDQSIWKYDGQLFYVPGLPMADDPLTATGVATGNRDGPRGTVNYASTLASGHKWKWRLVVVDKAGNRTEGDFTDTEPTRSTGAAAVWELSIGGGYSNYTQFGRARVNGAYTGLSPTVDSSTSNPKVGDIAFFWDNGQSRYIQREVTASASTSLTLSATSLDTDSSSPNYDNGNTPQFLDNAYISSNVRVELWRTKDDGDEYYFREEFPYNAGGLNFYDTAADADLTDALILPVYPRSWRNPGTGSYVNINVPAGRYLAKFNDQLLVSGNDQKPNTVFFSDIDGPEYFPQATHNFEIDERVTGMTQCGEVLLVFSQRRTYAVQGDLAEFNFRVDVIAEVGCVSHHSIQQLEEGVVAWLSEKGPYVSFGGRRIEPLGPKKYSDGAMVSRLEPFFTRVYATTATQPVFKRARSAHLPKDRLYLLYVPYEDPTEPSFGTTSGVVWAFDYGRGIWWKWSGLNCSGGMAVLNDLLYFCGFEQTGSGSAFGNLHNIRVSAQQRALSRTNSSDTGIYNHTDHGTAITWRWKAHWETLGRPSMFKRFLRNKVHSDETRAASSTTMTVYAYFDWDETRYWSDTITWTTQKSVKLKLRAETCQSMMVVFEQTSTYHAPPLITGYELEAVANFKPMIKE